MESSALTPPAIMITGASGLLGRALMREFHAFHAVGTAFSRTRGDLRKLDLLDPGQVSGFVDQVKPQVIIHAAAERRPDVVERNPAAARALNVDATGMLARLAGRSGAWLLFLSTDYVFDGTKPPYRSDDAPNPLNDYGRMKLEAEERIAPFQAGVLRVGLLFGEVETAGESVVTGLSEQVRSPRPSGVDHWANRYPTFVDDVAVVCRQMVERHLHGASMAGVWHWCGQERLTKYEQALAIAESLNLPASHLRPETEPPAGAPRPRDCRLDSSALESLRIGRRTPFRDALAVSLASLGLAPARR